MTRRSPLGRPGAGLRVASLGAVTLWLCTFVLSAILPSLAASKVNAALVEASSSSPTALAQAQSTAALASKLDPLSDAGPRAEATVALHLNNAAQARVYMLDAVKRDPSDVQAWTQLDFVEWQLRDSTDASRAADRAIELDPLGPFATQRPQLSLMVAPPQDSATATRTP